MRWVTTGGPEAQQRHPRRVGRATWANASPAVDPGAERSEVTPLTDGSSGLWAVLDLTGSPADSGQQDADSVELIELETPGPPTTGSGWTRRTLALGGFVATGILSSSLAHPTDVAPATGGLDLGASSAWDAHATIAGELAGLAGSNDDLINLSRPDHLGTEAPDLVRSRPPALLLTTELLRELAWTSTRDSLVPRLPVVSLDGTVLPTAGPSGSGRASAWQFGSLMAESSTPPVMSADEQVTIDRLVAIAYGAEQDRVTQERARQIETARLATEVETQRLASEAAQAAAVEAQRLAAEDAARVAAQAKAAQGADHGGNRGWSPQAPAEAPSAPAPAAAPAPAPEAAPAPAPADLAPAAAPAPANDSQSIEAAFFGMINQERAAAGLPALSFNAGLRASARGQATNIAAAGSLYHQNLQPLLGAGWRTAGENVGYGYDIAGLHAAFVASSGHYANMVNGNFSSLGVGVVVSGGRIWVAHVFAG